MVFKAAYLVDFDGTITNLDITSELVSYFGGEKARATDDAYRRREISICQWLRRTVGFLPGKPEQLMELILEWSGFRPGFDSFLEYARAEDRPVVVASDGFGFYIEPLLEKYGYFSRVSALYCNRVSVDHHGALVLETPHSHHSCPVCGNCKAAHALRLKEEGYSVIYIGDGDNDRFGASWADHVCARGELVSACRKNSFPCSQWSDFFDIIKVGIPEPADRSAASLCLPRGKGIKKMSALPGNNLSGGMSDRLPSND